MKKKAILLTAVSVMLIAAVATGLTLAYFTDTGTAKNTFTAGNVNIDLTETATADPDEGINGGTDNNNGGFEYKLFPGQVYAKRPVITVEEESELAYIIATVEISNMAKLDVLFDGVDVQTLFGGGIAGYVAAPGEWQGLTGFMMNNGIADIAFITRDVDDVNDLFIYTYYFLGTHTNVKLPALFETLSIPAGLNGDDMAVLAEMVIDINAYAVQAVGFDNAYAAFVAAFN